MTDSDKKVDFCEVERLINKHLLDLMDEQDESDLYMRENPPQKFTVELKNEQKTITPTDVVWLYEVGSFPFAINWLTKRFLAWKINRKIKRFNKWQEK